MSVERAGVILRHCGFCLFGGREVKERLSAVFFEHILFYQLAFVRGL